MWLLSPAGCPFRWSAKLRLAPVFAFAVVIAAGPALAAARMTCAQADAQVREIVAGILDVDQSRVVPSATLKELGEDLTDAADISIAIEKLYEVELQDEDYDNVVSILDLQKLVRRLIRCR